MLTQKRLKELLNYNPQTGIFTWNISLSNRVKVGDVAGSLTNVGYLSIRIDKKAYQAHHLAFLYMTGKFPTEFVDHKLGVRTDNRWEQLRQASRSQNAVNTELKANNSSGFRGVDWREDKQKFRSRLRFKNKVTHLGYFDLAEDASKVYEAFAKIVHGAFYRPQETRI